MQSVETRKDRNPIHRLDPFVAERIAAGEVIERPSSVVKELVENGLDAGATEIEVVLHEGGRSLIEVTDNGCGIPPEELELAIERHATSKVQNLDDLDRIRTLGFRGEALPSIAAVTHLTITSRTQDAPFAHTLDTRMGHSKEATRLTPEAPLHFLQTPHGTRIQAANLFSEIPARLKFLKSPASEVTHTREWLERIALAYPQTGFRLVSDGRTVLSVRPQTEHERARAILTAGEDLPVRASQTPQLQHGLDSAFRVRAYWVEGLSLPQSRRLIQVVNGRAVKDKLLHQAVMGAFKQLLLPGQYPAVALFVEMPPAAVDVNVHPTKSEVRFLDTSKIYRTVQTTLDQLIAGMLKPTPSPHFETQATSSSLRASEPQNFNTPLTFSFEGPFLSPQSIEQSHAASAAVTPIQGAQYLGIAFRTYLLFDAGEQLVLIDQHAAHERIRFEALKRIVLNQNHPSQQLLIPETASIRPEFAQNVGTTLTQLGFDAEAFGESSIVFRGIPQTWAEHSRPGAQQGQELKLRLQGLVERIQLELEQAEEGNSVLPAQRLREKFLQDEAIFERIASEACRSSVRAGDVLWETHARALVDQLFACEHPWNCPHGRPTVVKVPQSKFEEWFLRRVPQSAQ